MPDSAKSERVLIEDLIASLKQDYPEREFAYLKFYAPKQQILVYKTSFSAENYTRGQFFQYSKEDYESDRGNKFEKLNATVSELFVTDDYILLPIEFSDTVYGYLIAFHAQPTESPLLEKAARYVALTLRNLDLEKSKGDPAIAPRFEVQLDQRNFYEALSREISRARRIQLPVSMILVHIDFKMEQEEELNRVTKMIKENLRVYDFQAKLSEK